MEFKIIENYEDANPDPEYLIKSIAEQGYTLETSLADLIDNSITAAANKVEILLDLDNDPFTLFLADNGYGMSEDELRINMQFPSSSPDNNREKGDLGRFGLGMKTASFSQTRRFTVLTRKRGDIRFVGRTWDVDFLKKNKKWKILVSTEDEIRGLLNKYFYLSSSYLNSFDDFCPSTIVVWQGLYKYEDFIAPDKRKQAVQQEINEITNEYLSIVFHRYMERSNCPLSIRVNNQRVLPFNPFPTCETDLRSIVPKHKVIKSDSLSMTGFILPSRSMKEAKAGASNWTTNSKSLMDMEGIYVYRSDRLIRFGGWNGIIKKSPRLQLARLMVELGNGMDDIIHLNVSKSQITIPFEIKVAFLKYLAELKAEAEKEYVNTMFTVTNPQKNNTENVQIFFKQPTNKGNIIRINNRFPLIEVFRKNLSSSQNIQLNVLFRIFQNAINRMRLGDDFDSARIIIDDIENSDAENLNAIVTLLSSGMSKDAVKKHFIPLIGLEINNLPSSIKNLLKNE